MNGVFGAREPERAEPHRDTELTLGFTALLSIFFGLVLLCGLCFGLGYTAGRRGTEEPSASLPSAGSAATQPDNGHSKPSGDAPSAASGAQPSAASDQQGSALPNTPGASVQSAAVAAASGSSNGTPEVRPALDSAANPAQPGQPTASAVAPALGTAPPSAGSLMVQIAAVSQPEDSDVLVSALRKRGYAVTAHREPLDGLIHVKIGPFKTRDEADKWRQKLLNDGYNAIIQP
jgi:cell division septation protein DedD